jgi:CRP/FNR family transcriptional regulator, anaerobic regulatory protein
MVHMTNRVRQKRGPHAPPHGAGGLGAGGLGTSDVNAPFNSWPGNALRAIEEVATVVRLKRGDKLELCRERSKLVYAVRSGYLMLQSELSASRRVAISLYSPGSILRLCELPPLRSLAAVATAPCQVLRMGEALFDRLCEQSAEVRRYCAQEASLHSARDRAHIVLLAGLSGEERVAGFFVEMACRMGRRHGPNVSVEIPFSRCDIAHYLALNPDTLSRIFSRLKQIGLIRTSGRRSVEILDLEALSRMCPSNLCEAEVEGTHVGIGGRNPIGVIDR